MKHNTNKLKPISSVFCQISYVFRGYRKRIFVSERLRQASRQAKFQISHKDAAWIPVNFASYFNSP